MGKGIIIDIGFTSDIKKYITDLEKEIKSVDFQKIIGLSESFDKEYQKMSEFIKAMKNELRSLGSSDVNKLSSQLTNIQTLTEKLTKSFLTLFSALPKDTQKNLGITSIVKELSEISGICGEATTAVADLNKAASGKVKIVDEKQIELLKNSYREIKRVLELIQEPRKKGGYDGFNDTNEIIKETIVQYSRLQNAVQSYEKIKNGQGKGLSTDKVIIGYAESLERLQGLINLYNEAPGADANKLIKPLKMSFNELSTYINNQLIIIEDITKSRLNHIAELGEKAGIDLRSYFTQSTRKGEEPIRVSLALQKGAKKTLYNQVIEKVGEVQSELDQHPLIVEVQLASAYQSKKNQTGINEIKNQIAKLEEQAAHAGSQAEALKITSISKNLTELIDRMNRQIDNALAITIDIETTEASKAVRTFIKEAKKELESLKDAVVITPTFQVSPEEINKIKTEMVNALTEEDNSEIKSKVIDALINKLSRISEKLKELSDSSKALLSTDFDENILNKAESLNIMYTQLLMVNDELNTFIKGIGKLSKEKISNTMLAMMAENGQAMKTSLELVRAAMPTTTAESIELTLKNKDIILQDISEIKEELKSIFDISQVEKWENAVISALSHIKMPINNSGKSMELFNQGDVKNDLNLFSYFVNDIIRSDQLIRKSTFGTYAEDTESEKKIIETLLGQVEDAVESFNFGDIDRKEYDKTLKTIVKTMLTSIEEDAKLKPREHGGLLTRDLNVIGLSASQRPKSAHNLRKESGLSDKDILSTIHSHSGDIIWMPSKVDLNNASKQKSIPFYTTIAEKETSVIDTAKISAFVNKFGKDVFDKIYQELDSYDYSRLASTKKFQEFRKPYLDYRNDLIKQGVKVNTKREDFLLERRYALEQILKSKYNTSLGSFAKLYSSKDLANANPFGLGITKNNFQNTNRINNNQKLNDLTEIFNGLSKGLSDLNKNKSFESLRLFIESLNNLPTEKNPVLTQLENVTKNADAIKAASEALKSGNKDALKPPKQTKEDAERMLLNNESTIRSTANDFLSKRLGIFNPDQIEAASKEAQAILNRTWSDYNIVDELVKSGGMESSVAEEYANAFVDNYINAMRNGLQVNLTGEQQSFLEPFKEMIPEQVTNNSKFLITEMKAMADGLVHITALVKDANGEYQKLVLTYNQVGDTGSLALNKIEIDSEAAKTAMSALDEKVEKVVYQLGHVNMRSTEWEALKSKIQEMGLSLEDVDQILRQVDRDGSESFRIFDKFGNVHTIGMSSDGFLFIKEAVMRSKEYLISEFTKMSDLIPKLLNDAFKGDANAGVKAEGIFDKIRELFTELSSLPEEMMSNDKLSELSTYFATTFSKAYNAVDKISIKKKSPEFLEMLDNIKALLEDTQNLAEGGNFDAVRNNIIALANAFVQLGNSLPGAKGQTVVELDKIFAKVGKDMQNTAMPKQLMREYQALNDAIIEAKNNSKDGFIPLEVFDEIKARFANLHAQLEQTGQLGKSMGDKIGRSLKNSLISVVRMYLSWYRWIAYIRQGIQEVTNLDTALTKMSYTMNITDAQLQDISKQMVSMAKELSSSVENISQIYQIYANLQTTQEELAKTAKPTAILANLSGTDASTAADQLQGVLNQFELTADDAMHIVDVYDKISASIKVDYSKGIAGMADAVKNVGNFANEAGMSFEQLSAIVGRVMQQTRMEGGQIGVSLKTIMTRISKANKLADDGEVDNKTLSQASQALKRWADIDVYTPSGEFREFDVIMTELAAKWDQLSDAEQANISFAIAATRQTAVLKAVLQNWTDAMNLATEAVNANGNALANQEKYEESLAGRTQALKTELSALWIELIDSDAVKSLVDSVKEMVISLEDSATGLKPVVDLLAQLLKIVSKIISVIPAGGLIATILGFKYGGVLSLNNLTKVITKLNGFRANLNLIYEGAGATEAAIFGLKTAFSSLGKVIASNPLGFTILAFTTFATIYNKFHKTAEEVHQELVQAYEDASLAVSNTEQEISNLTNKLEEQQQIINNLSGKKLSYYDSEQLQKAKMMTSEIESQLNMAKERYKYEMSLKANAAVPLWNEKYIWNRDELIQKYIDAAPQAMKNAYSNDFIEEYITEHFDIANEWLKDIPDIVKAVNGLINWEDIDTGKAASEISALDDYLEEYKKYYKLISEDGSDELFAAEYTNIQEIRNAAKQLLFKEDWDAELFSGIIYSDDEQIQNELNKLEEAVNKWKERYPWHAEDDVYIFDLINKLINSNDFEALREKVQEELFSTSKWDKSNNAYIFGKMFYKEFRDGVEEEHTRNPIDLSTWFADPSSIDSDRTWNDIVDSVESGLNSLGAVLEKHINANEVIDPLEIFKITDINDSIFQQLGFDKFEDYLARYMSRLSEDQKKDGKAIQFALTDYILEAYQNFLKNVDDPDSIEGFKLITEQFEKWINAARGGSNVVDTIDKSYERLIQTLNDVKSGKLFEAEEISELMVEYDALGDSIKVVGDKYSIEEDALIDLINQYITYGNEAVASQISAAEAAVESAQIIMDSYDLVYDKLQMMVEAYHGMVDSGVDENRARETMSHVFGVPLTDELVAAVDKYVKESGNLNELREKLKKFAEGKNKYSKDSGNEIDWIANSLENITRAAEKAKQAYDNLFSPSGSLANVKEANKLLDEHKARLHDLELGTQKAADSYQKEINKLNLTEEQIKKIENVALGYEKAWTIEEFKGDSELYDKMNKGLDLTKKRLDAEKEIANLQHQQIEEEIQKLQNWSDYYSAIIDKFEANISNTNSIKTQQKYVDKIVEATKAQYAQDKEIAKLKGDLVELAKLEEEEELKINELLVRRSQIAIDAIQKRYDRVISEFENRQSILEHGITMTEAKGSLVSTEYYKALIDNERSSIDAMLKERKRLVKELNQINIEKEGGLDEWWNTKDAIDELTASLYQSEEALVEWKNAIRQVGWDLFDRIADTVHGVVDESEYLINLFSNDDAYKYAKEVWGNDGSRTKVYYGEMSKEGLATLGLYELQIKTNTELAEKYAEEIADLNKQIKKNPTDLTLIDRRNELIEKQRESIQAVEEEKKAILNLVQEGYDKQLESMETLISKYMEALNAEKSLYDYQKNIKKQTKDIVNLRKQIAAYANDTSEEARGKLQQLTVQLQEAEEGLQDTQYDRYLSDQQEILDRMYNTFEDYVDDKMSDQKKVLKEISATVNSNQKTINSTVKEKTTELGSTLSQTMKNILKEPITNGKTIEQMISAKDTDITAIAASTSSTDSILQAFKDNYDKETWKTTIGTISTTIDNINTNLVKIANSLGLKVDETGTLNTTTETTKGYAGGSAVKPLSDKKLEATDEAAGLFWGVSKDDFVNGTRDVSAKYAAAVYNKMTTKYDSNKYLYEDPKYGPFEDTSRIYNIMYNWLKRNGYASGARRLRKDELAWTQEQGLEAIVRPSDGAILTPLAKNDSVLTAGATQNIWDMANNPIKFIKDNLSFPVNVHSANGGNFDIQQSMAITLPNVKNYPEFVTALQNDKRFEQMIQDMTVNQLTGGSKLAKHKYNFN